MELNLNKHNFAVYVDGRIELLRFSNLDCAIRTAYDIATYGNSEFPRAKRINVFVFDIEKRLEYDLSFINERIHYLTLLDITQNVLN